MSEKFEDLFPTIRDDEPFEFTRAELNGVRVALRWLDEHPDRAPGRTITESELKDLSHDYYSSGRSVDAILSRLGVIVVPDPEPTNAEKLEAALRRCNYAGGPEYIAQQLDEAGVTAP